MKYATATIVLASFVALTAIPAATAMTRAQCEPKCSSQLETCATKTANNGCIGTPQGCKAAGREKCKLGGTGFEGPYNTCIQKCLNPGQ